MKFEEPIREFLAERGALRVGFCTRETLAGGPPSADLTYVLPSARSAVTFALPLDRDIMRQCLAKKSQFAFEQHNIDVNLKAGRIAKELALWLEEKGYKSVRIHANNVYRKDEPNWQLAMRPDVSHRYLAVRSGVGSFGWSGNVGIKGYGSAIILGSVVTELALEPTPPLPPEEGFCDRCKLCVASCPSGMFHDSRETSVTLGGQTFSYSERISYLPCQLVCGGFTGLSKNKKWSTWSPGRYVIPDPADENSQMETLVRAVGNYTKWPRRSDGDGGFENNAFGGLNIRLTCGNCQMVCRGDREETKENYRLLTTSGCVIQREDGTIEVLGAEDAAREFERMPPEHTTLYR
ncbi:4Fe-4S ferredoxin iron-sulfur-binding domain-containing protein [Desulfosudis oleivorans]|uniref:4Fe-4S ferredoxin iron-sulfur binding domain protein n=1 Tax=Desulfosudis oleivorans (strain DSM 6200 / JCM 39069 / Hxd3) TaxID=96561 RepID=A8ZSS4_DESOH|nr:4Fe-4S ferredoxin iron-sulfur-binding domain-containing protein [Desulfosudis oleivorans]ABW65987.1 4Fe-4S ferredoxin iron-sulfur binding domain protein [Desulfosudis oleivorans Hxd3]